MNSWLVCGELKTALFVSVNEPNTNNRSFSPEDCASPARLGLQRGPGGHVATHNFLPWFYLCCHCRAENTLVPSIFWDVGVHGRHTYERQHDL